MLFKKIIIILTLLFTSQVYALDAKVCTDRSAYVYSIAAARDRHITKEVITARVKELVGDGSHGVSIDDIPEMLFIINKVYAHEDHTPEELAKTYFVYCLELTES